MRWVLGVLLGLMLMLPVLADRVWAQEVKTIKLGKGKGSAYSFHGLTNGRLRTFSSDAEAEGVVKQVLASMGLPLRFDVRAAAVGNAAAIVEGNGKRSILYNTIFMDEIQARTGRYWSLISIMAHEIGHHLAFHLDENIEDHEAELEADYFSGYILAKMGATMDDALSAMRELAGEEATKTHPGKKERLQAIAAGFKNASKGQQATPNQALASLQRQPEPSALSTVRGFQHQASPRESADACADRLGLLYCVSSYLPTSGVNRSDYGPASLFDQSNLTAWVEGRTARRDDGIGEWILLDWQQERLVNGITLKNGYWKSARLWQANGRVTRLRLRFSSGRSVDVDVHDSDRAQDITFDRPEKAMWVQLEILKAKRGTKYSDTAINELDVRFQ